MRKLSPKQQVVLDYLAHNPAMTLSKAVELIGGDVYANKRFHVGQVLTRMIKRNLIVRVKRGVYAAARNLPQQSVGDLPLWERKMPDPLWNESDATGSSATPSEKPKRHET